MAFENIGRDCDREMEKLAQELLKMEKELAQQLFRGIANLYNSWKEHQSDNRLNEELQKNQHLKEELEAAKINLKKMFDEFKQTGFDPNRPQQDPTQGQTQEQHQKQEQEFGEQFNDLDIDPNSNISDINLDDNVMNFDDLNLDEIGDTFSMGNMNNDMEFEQMSLFDGFDLDVPEMGGPNLDMDNALDNFEFDGPDLDL